MSVRPWLCSLWVPAFVATCIAGFFVVTRPGDIRKDAYEYDQIARNLLAGNGYTYQGRPTMMREPGYPVFRAVAYRLGANEQNILWLQVLLVGLCVHLIGSAFRLMDEETGSVAALGAALAYGFSVYAASHYNEAFTGFLVACTGYTAVRCSMTKLPWYRYALLVVSTAALTLTRMNMAFIPPALFAAVAMSHSTIWRQRLKLVSVLGLAWLVLLLPWVVRNGKQFGEWTIAGRSGIQFYARMVKAREPSSRLGASVLSVVASRVASSSLGLNPIFVEDQWVLTAKRYFELAEIPARSPADIDRLMRQEAFSVFRSRPVVLMRYFAWTPVEILRLWAIPSPTSSSFPIENTCYLAWQRGNCSPIRILSLAVFHILQLGFWVALAFAVYQGWKLYAWRWVPGWIFLAVTLAHMPFDAIIRYSAPVQPWVWASVAWYLGRCIQAKIPDLQKRFPSLTLRRKI